MVGGSVLERGLGNDLSVQGHKLVKAADNRVGAQEYVEAVHRGPRRVDRI